MHQWYTLPGWALHPNAALSIKTSPTDSTWINPSEIYILEGYPDYNEDDSVSFVNYPFDAIGSNTFDNWSLNPATRDHFLPDWLNHKWKPHDVTKPIQLQTLRGTTRPLPTRTVAWSNVEHATSYQVELSTNPNFMVPGVLSPDEQNIPTTWNETYIEQLNQLNPGAEDEQYFREGSNRNELNATHFAAIQMQEQILDYRVSLPTSYFVSLWQMAENEVIQFFRDWMNTEAISDALEELHPTFSSYTGVSDPEITADSTLTFGHTQNVEFLDMSSGGASIALSRSNTVPQTVTAKFSGNSGTFALKVKGVVIRIPAIPSLSSMSSFKFTNLKPSTTYYWRVRGVGKYLLGPWSEAKSFDIGPKPRLNIQNNGCKEITVGVKSTSFLNDFLTSTNSSSSTNHDIQVSNSYDFRYLDLNVKFYGEPTFTASDLMPNSVYFYRVKSSDSPNWGNPVLFTTDTCNMEISSDQSANQATTTQ